MPFGATCRCICAFHHFLENCAFWLNLGRLLFAQAWQRSVRARSVDPEGRDGRRILPRLDKSRRDCYGRLRSSLDPRESQGTSLIASKTEVSRLGAVSEGSWVLTCLEGSWEHHFHLPEQSRPKIPKFLFSTRCSGVSASDLTKPRTGQNELRQLRGNFRTENFGTKVSTREGEGECNVSCRVAKIHYQKEKLGLQNLLASGTEAQELWDRGRTISANSQARRLCLRSISSSSDRVNADSAALYQSSASMFSWCHRPWSAGWTKFSRVEEIEKRTPVFRFSNCIPNFFQQSATTSRADCTDKRCPEGPGKAVVHTPGVRTQCAKDTDRTRVKTLAGDKIDAG